MGLGGSWSVKAVGAGSGSARRGAAGQGGRGKVRLGVVR